MPLVRRLALALVAALAFCTTAAAAGGDPQYRPADADQRWADAIVLSAKDFSGLWKPSGTSGRLTTGGIESAACSLADESDLVVTGGSYSPSFTRFDGAWVSSAAVVWQTQEHAEADWGRNLQPAIMGCLAAELQAASTKRVKVVVTKRQQLAWPALAPRTTAYRLSLVLKAGKRSTRATSDFIAVGASRATALLWTVSFNSQPLTNSSKQNYALSMLRRMAADPSAPS